MRVVSLRETVREKEFTRGIPIYYKNLIIVSDQTLIGESESPGSEISERLSRIRNFIRKFHYIRNYKAS